ncbi:MAG: response regulator [Phycisphaerales bacterium]|nr:response regulator [Phycisphaerales bacterium]
MAEPKSILLVEDEADLSELIATNLEREGYSCRRQFDGASALAEVQRRPPDLILLDRMIPKVSGDEVARRLKREARTASIPIIMLTAKAEESDELIGFAIGADDYVRKPFTMKLLMARVAAILRRSDPAAVDTDVIASGPVVLDRSRHEVRVGEQSVSLTATEFRVLATLMLARGRVLDRDQLLDEVVGSGVGVTNRTIDVHIASLRKKLGPAAGWIQTIRGVGYTFREPAHSAIGQGS